MRTATAIALSLSLLCGVSASTAHAESSDDYETTTKCGMTARAHYSMTALLRHGIGVPVRCDGPASVVVALQIDRPQALDLRMPGNGIQDVWADKQVAHAGVTKLRMTMDKRSRKRLSSHDRMFSGTIFLCVGPYGTQRCSGTANGSHRVTFTR